MKWAALIALAVVLADQTTKWMVVQWIEPDSAVVVIRGWFDLVHWQNPGAAWGILRDYNMWLAVVSVGTILALVLFRHSFPLHETGTRVALGLVSGGILGNLIDRIRWGAVVDFLDFSMPVEPFRSWLSGRLGSSHWPAFNVADSAICLGVGLYLVASWRSDKAARGRAPGAKTPSKVDESKDRPTDS